MSDQKTHLVETWAGDTLRRGAIVYATVAPGPRPTIYLRITTPNTVTKLGPLTITEAEQIRDMLAQRIREATS